MMQWIKKIGLGIVAALATISSLVLLGPSFDRPVFPTEEHTVGANFAEAQWISIKQFSGFQTKADATKIADGANPNGQNTIINDGDRISIRPFGYTILGTATTTASPIISLHTFRKRSGENIMIRSYGSVLEYFERGNSTWENLNTGYTSGQEFGFADYNINTDQRSYVYFGNAVEPYSRWTGAHTQLNGAIAGGELSITVDDTTDFTATGTLHYCSTDLVYTAKTATTFTATTTVACADNSGIIQAVQTNTSSPRGNIFLNANNRIFVAGITSTPQAVYFSTYGDATNFVNATLVVYNTATAPGIFNLGEGGGAVTGMVLDEGAIYIFKKSITYKATLTDALYSLQPLKPFDGKSQTTGSVNRDTIFTGGNGVFFISPDNQIMNLTRVATVDYPQIIPISDPIKPTVDDIVFTSSTGISFKDKAYIATKSSALVSANDSVLLYNERLGVWESPLIGWSPNCFTIYDDGTGDHLYFGDAYTANVYEVTDDAVDNELGVTANWRSKKFDFGNPEELKEVDSIYVEGYISDNTTLTVSLLLDDEGFTQTYTTNILGTESDFIFDATPFNLFGFHPFGFERFGSSDASTKKKFRVYLNKNVRQMPFYIAQIEFASDGVGQAWEITDFSFHVRKSSQPERRSLYRTFQ